MTVAAERITVDADLVSAHASRVIAVSSGVAAAADAAGSANVGGGAFGVLCAFLVGPAAVATSMAQQAIRSAEGMLERSAREVRGVAADLDAYEDDVVRVVSALAAEVSR